MPARIANAVAAVLKPSSNVMDDLYDVVVTMFAVVIAAIMLVAGELYLVTRPDPPEKYTPPPSIVTSAINR
jgi:hypothetical protein